MNTMSRFEKAARIDEFIIRATLLSSRSRTLAWSEVGVFHADGTLNYRGALIAGLKFGVEVLEVTHTTTMDADLRQTIYHCVLQIKDFPQRFAGSSRLSPEIARGFAFRAGVSAITKSPSYIERQNISRQKEIR